MFLLTFLLVGIILFFLGCAIGSFLNVVIYRSVAGESWVAGRSHCDHCKKNIAWYDNIPLVSYILLNGKSRCCKKQLSISHPVIEFMTGSLFLWWWVGGSLFFKLSSQPFHYIQPLFWLCVGLLLIIIFFADLLYFIIPDEAVVILTALTIIYRLSLILSHEMQLMDFAKTVLGMAICTGFFFLLWFGTKGKGMGFGDVKFMIPFSLLLGWPDMFVGVFFAFVIGAAFSLVLLVTKQKTMKQIVPFGPFLVVSTIITLVFGNQILTWYLGLMR
jgi:leader peptidase (prepilin peptidase)/N-methyltransferase